MHPWNENPQLNHASSLQGIPLGLTFGTLPFLLKSHLSYSQLAIFALSTWPYSLKLLWSPIVDAWFVKKWGRRKSWIVPVQGLVGLGMWVIGGKIEEWLNVVSPGLFFSKINTGEGEKTERGDAGNCRRQVFNGSLWISHLGGCYPRYRC